jgi:hypothetical protein
MGKEEYRDHLEQLWMLAHIIEGKTEISEMIAAQEISDTTVWFMHPTLAMDKETRERFAEDRLMCKALRTVQVTVEHIRKAREERAAKAVPVPMTVDT